MIVSSLTLKDFRCYQKLETNFSNGINFLYGKNASGKTSIVEAIYYLSLARSFKTSKDKELIKNGSNEALIQAKIAYQDSFKNINILLLDKGKKILIDKKQIHKISELSKIINVIYFIPKDVLLLKDPPGSRRLFLNIAIAKESNKYLDLYLKYEKLLHARNEILKNEIINEELLEVITNQIIKISKEIYLFRNDYIKKLNQVIKKLYKHITDKDDDIEIIYDSFINNYEEYESIAAKKYLLSKEEDIYKKCTNIGVHKEDFHILLNSKNVAKYGSQGENRLIVLTLKLSPYELINVEDKKPIVILDDVLSELDETNQKRLIKYLKNIKQVFITSTQKTILENDIKYYLVENHTIKEGEQAC
jgi:DNA replication and repair protein RecF